MTTWSSHAIAGQSLQWGSAEANSASNSATVEQKPSTPMICDPQVIAAAWEDADAAAAANREVDPIYVAERHSVVVKRDSIPQNDSINLFENSLEDERLAQLPEDPFDSTPVEEFVPATGSENLDLFGSEEPEATQEMAPIVEDQAPVTEIAASDSQYDLFNEPMDLFDGAGEAEDFDAPQSHDRFEVQMPTAGDEFSPQEKSDTDSADLWMTSQEITPTEEPTVAPRTSADPSGIFEILTQGDTESEEFEERYQYQIDELQRELIGDDPNDWMNMDLPQPNKEELSELQRKILEAERAQNEESCKEEIDKLRAQKVENIDLSIRLEGSAGQDFPFECTLEDQRPEPREWSQITYMWKASGLCHKPLYFEQVHLERYGHSWGPIAQPLLSGVHFFGTIPILPYKMGLKTPNECVYSLGYYRPGDCAPYMIDAIPFTWRAAGYQAGFATGLNFILP